MDKIIYYKGKRHLLLEDMGELSRIREEAFENITKLVETKRLLSPEEFEKKKANRRSQHQTW